MPLHALLIGEQRVIERWPVAYVPSASALVAMGAHSLVNVRACAVLGAHFIKEAEQVASILGTNAITCALDKGSILRALAENDVVHLSAHGFYVPDAPERSGLVIAPSAELNDYLRALRRPRAQTWEGARLHLDAWRGRVEGGVIDVEDLASASGRARLVTLSACETGLVRTDAADDPVGLVPALLAAGVNGVVATLWMVSADSTATMMRTFYTALTQPGGWDRVAWALRDAVNAVRVSHPHPYYWAAVMLAGGVHRGTTEGS